MQIPLGKAPQWVKGRKILSSLYLDLVNVSLRITVFRRGLCEGVWMLGPKVIAGMFGSI